MVLLQDTKTRPDEYIYYQDHLISRRRTSITYFFLHFIAKKKYAETIVNILTRLICGSKVSTFAGRSIAHSRFASMGLKTIVYS